MPSAPIENQPRYTSKASLWRRAPIWRAILVCAVTLSAVTGGLWLASRQESAGPQSSAAVTPKTDQQAQRPASDVSPVPVPDKQAPSEEQQSEAVCHPHLLRAAARMPQIDVSGVAAPNLEHLKVHFWVNGAGLVTREVITEANLGSPAELTAETAFTRSLVFAVPNTKDCQSREIELVGDFFEQRNASGTWETLVRLYPRFSISNSGQLQDAN